MTSDTAAHTPGPWEIMQTRHGWTICNPDEGWSVCSLPDDEPTHEANAAFIVCAVNNHTGLLAALKDAANRLRGAGMLAAEDEILVALSKAGAGQ